MKRGMLLTVVGMGLALLQGCNYLAVTGGKGGPVAVIEELETEGTTSFSVEYGGPRQQATQDREFMLTGGIAYIKHADCWWSDYVALGPEIGSFIKIGVEVVPDSGFFANVLGGVTFLSWSSIWTDKQIEVHPMFGGGITYFINNQDTCLIASYDNRRGFSAGVGFRF